MHLPAMPSLQQSTSGMHPRPLPGTWGLPAGRALSLRPAWPGQLEVARGRVWLTVSGPGAPACDLVLGAGATHTLQPGQHAVLEAWGAPAADPVALRWDAWALLQAGAAEAAPPAAEVRQAWQALREAVAALGPPLGALVRGVLAQVRGAVGRRAAPPAVACPGVGALFRPGQ